MKFLIVVFMNLLSIQFVHAIYPTEYYVREERVWNDLRAKLEASPINREQFVLIRSRLINYRFENPSESVLTAYIRFVDALGTSLQKLGDRSHEVFDPAEFKDLVDGAYHAIQIARAPVELRRSVLSQLKSFEDQWLSCERLVK